MRAAIYARYSSDQQREASIDDQVEICRRYAGAQGWEVVTVYGDRAISGASRFRAEYQQMVADAEGRRFDVIVCEALDRLGRKLSDVAELHDRLQFAGVKLHAVKIGEVTTLHVGLMGTMAQLYLSDLRDKTKRGQLGRALAGRVPGGQAFGYALVDGKTGERTILAEEAEIVRRIFRDFAAGRSPRAIAKALNAEGVPGPAGREWRDTTIRGQPERGTGILNNALYVGRLEWNRCSYVKDPRSGKRVARPNPRKMWEIVAVPELRIIDDDLWDTVRARQDELRHQVRDQAGSGLNAAHRAKSLLAGMLRCGACGGAYTVTGKDRYGCATRRAKGTCSNSATVGRAELERRVLEGLKTRLMAPELVRTFIDEFQREMNKAAAEQVRIAEAAQQKLQATARKIASLVTAIENGGWSPALAERLRALEAEQAGLIASSAPQPAPVLRMHPGAADIYAAKVADLELALNAPEIRGEANEVLSSLIDKVEITPRAGGGVDAMLYGDLARILALCETADKKKRPAAGAEGRQLSVVAGAGFEPATFRL